MHLNKNKSEKTPQQHFEGNQSAKIISNMTRKSVVITLQMPLKICKVKHVRVPKYVHKIVKHVVQFLFTEEDSALKT
jgi:hypothetical protein